MPNDADCVQKTLLIGQKKRLLYVKGIMLGNEVSIFTYCVRHEIQIIYVAILGDYSSTLTGSRARVHIVVFSQLRNTYRGGSFKEIERSWLS